MPVPASEPIPDLPPASVGEPEAPGTSPAGPVPPEVDTQATSGGAASAAPRRYATLGRTALLLAGSTLACIIAYLAFAVPAAWFPSATAVAFPAARLTVTRGAGQVIGDELVIQSAGPGNLTVVSVVTNLRSSDYPVISWIAIGLPERTDAQLVWRTTYASERMSGKRVAVEAGRLLPVTVADDPQWIGTITGVALAIRGPLQQPIRIRGMVAKPMSAMEVLQDRAREWFAFESWTGTSINTLNGGAELQGLPLPLLLACIVALAVAAAYALWAWRPSLLGVSLPPVIAFCFIAAWLLLDLRWTGNLVQQTRATATQFGGKSSREKHLASEDGALFAFVERAKEVLPPTPVRVFVASDPQYFRLRAAYHLYPHSVYSPRGEELPRASDVKPGDWFLVYGRRGIQFDPARHSLRWGDNQTVTADAKLVESGAALFLVR